MLGVPDAGLHSDLGQPPSPDMLGVPDAGCTSDLR